MDATEIEAVQEQHDNICEAIAKAIKADRTLVSREEHFAHLITSDSVTYFAPNYNGEFIYVNLRVWTNTTGGSYEYPEAEIPLDTLNKYL